MPKPKYTSPIETVDILPDKSPKWRALESIIHEKTLSVI